MNEICYIVCAGDSVPLDFTVSPNDLVIAADGGLNYLKKAGITPNVLIGDFDSLGYVPNDEPEIIRLSPIKDMTDTFAAAQEGLERGYKKFRIFCALGGRLSHTLANINTLTYLYEKGADTTIVGQDSEMFITDSSAAICGGKYFSVFPLGDTATVKITGSKYSGTFTFTYTDSLGVSNEPMSNARIEVINGRVLVIIERE